MSSTAVPAARPSFSNRLLAGGLIASAVMAMWQMIAEAVLPSGAGFWSPPVYIAATVLRSLQNVPRPVPFDLLGVIVGMMGHMMNSIVFGLISAFLIAPRLRSRGGQVVAGAIYGIAIYLLMWYLVVPLADPVMLNQNAFAFFLAHVLWGAALGWVNAAFALRR